MSLGPSIFESFNLYLQNLFFGVFVREIEVVGCFIYHHDVSFFVWQNYIEKCPAPHVLIELNMRWLHTLILFMYPTVFLNGRLSCFIFINVHVNYIVVMYIYN